MASSPLDSAPEAVAAVVQRVTRDGAGVEALQSELDALRRELTDMKKALAARPAEPDSDEVAEVMVYFDKRLDVIDARSREQDTALRRVLTLLVDWVERDDRSASHRSQAA